tara:strand:- start:8202 stop:9569 length:1368 start_codon:yes stop_codon:yes gene_type:complete
MIFNAKMKYYLFDNFSRIACFVFIFLVILSTASAQVIAPDDYVYVIKESPLKVKQKTTAAVPAGTMLKVEEVQGKWLWTTFIDTTEGLKFKEGWIDKNHVIKKPKNKKLRFNPQQETLEPNDNYQYFLPKGEPIEIQFQSSHSGIDFFIVSEEGLSAYKWVMKNGSGRVTSYKKKLNSQEESFTWQPPDNDQYYFLIDNTSFPDSGADGRHTTTVTTFFWSEDNTPSEPIDGRGLIIRKVSIEFDNYKGRNDVYNGPLTAIIGYKHKVESGEKPKPDGEIEAKVDKNGFFFAGNVPKDRYYWIQSIKTTAFESPVPFKFYSQVDYEKDEPTYVDLGLACITSGMESKETGVLDIGYYDLKVVSNGAIVIELTIPFDQFSNEKSINVFGTGKNLETELSRHAWFKSNYSKSGWTEKVVADLKWIQDERARMKKRKTGSKNPFAPDPPKSAPAPKKE